MQNIADRSWWCPRCGTLKLNERKDSLGTYEPRIVERIANYFEAASEEDREIARAAVEECLNEHRGHCEGNVEAGEAGTGPSVDQS
jgi:hypothetical protein